MTHKTIFAFATAASLVLFGPAAHAATVVPSLTITVDENGNGSVTSSTGTTSLTSSLLPDFGPGGLTSVLTYNLGETLNVAFGDVRILEPGGILGDDVRFEVPGPDMLLFYSAKPSGSLADTGLPTAFFSNNTTILEGPNGTATYTPMPGQPGFSSSFAITYDFVSDTPLPAALPLFATGIGALGLLSWRRKRKAASKLVCE
jgi:hypothetical protein